MKKLTEVQKLQRRISEIREKCKHNKFKVIRGASGVLNFFTIECLICGQENTYCTSSTCVKCLGKMKFVKNGKCVPIGGGGCAEFQEELYKCINCGHEYWGGRTID